MRLRVTGFNVGVSVHDGSRWRWTGERWTPAHYLTGADGWVERCNAAGLNVEAMTELFLREVRISIPMALADAIIGVTALQGQPLSPRERQVYDLMTEGMPRSEVAARLGISEETVKTLRSRASSKLAAKQRA